MFDAKCLLRIKYTLNKSRVTNRIDRHSMFENQQLKVQSDRFSPPRSPSFLLNQ